MSPPSTSVQLGEYTSIPALETLSLYLNFAPVPTCAVTARMLRSRPSSDTSSIGMAGLRRSGQVSSVPSHALNPPIGRRYTKNEVGLAASTSRRNDSLMPRTTDDIATTTNTPSATPMMVSPARTLFERRASSAMPTPSNAIENGVKIRIGYSARSATIGSSRAAFRAGYMPDATPTPRPSSVATTSDQGATAAGSGVFHEMIFAARMPSPM